MNDAKDRSAERAEKPDNADEKPGHDELHIFVNRLKFTRENGVRPKMTAGEIAGLVNVPTENAVVRREGGGPESDPIPVNSELKLRNGEHFLVTRKHVDGGMSPRATTNGTHSA